MSELDLSLRLIEPVPRGPNRPAKIAIVAALLLHLLLALWLFAHPLEEATPTPPVIAVTLVQPPPPPPPAPAQVQPKPPPPQEQKPAYRESGKDQRTTQAPRAEEKAPEPSVPPPSTATEQKPAEQPTTAAPTQEGLEPPPPPQEKPQQAAPAPPAPQKPKLALRAPKVEPPVDDRMLGEDNESGDPYLNALWSRIEANRQPTTPIGPAGLHLAGISTFRLVLDHAGHMEGLDLMTSSGSPVLDTEAKRMIVAATPFPALPPDYPNEVALRVTIRLYPR